MDELTPEGAAEGVKNRGSRLKSVYNNSVLSEFFAGGACESSGDAPGPPSDDAPGPSCPSAQVWAADLGVCCKF